MRTFLLLLYLSFAGVLSAQDGIEVKVHRTNETIKIDGVLDEAIWVDNSTTPPFWQYAPNDSIYAEQQTEIKMAFDDNFLYISAKCYSKSDDYVVTSLKRDFRAGGNDNITFLIDPFNDRTNAFMFGTNPMGVQREGLISGGGANIRGFSTDWDNKWRCESKYEKDYWSTELAIPLSILRFNKDVKTWRFNAYRFDTQNNERSTWIRIPRNQWIFNLAFMAEMNWEEAPKSKSNRATFIPYVINNNNVDYEGDGKWRNTINAGGDIKIPVSSGLNLDLTINPDFSQVEVDQQITNLSRFEIFFPEKRQFFLENADLFGSGGFRNANPFFSRRIGISTDTVTGDNILNTIYGGTRLSGKINDKVRIGVLDMIAAPDIENGLPTYNYNVISAQYKLWERSNIGIISVNKDAVANRDLLTENLTNRVLGLDFNLATSDNKWSAKSFIHRSFSDFETGKAPWSHGTSIRYLKKAYNLRWDHQFVGEGFDAQVGFVPRKDYIAYNPSIELYFYKTESKLNRITTSFSLWSLYNTSFKLTDRIANIRVGLEYVNQSRLDFRLSNSFIFLTDNWDPTGTDSEELPADVSYNFTNLRFSYNSDRSKAFSYRVNSNLGQYYTGRRYGIGGSLNYRIQPLANFSLNYNYNVFDMPYLDGLRSTVILGPRIDLSFTKKLFLSGSLQYNSQSENSNLNIRFQYRYAPVSDLFIVYTDNYFTDLDGVSPNVVQFNSRNRALVLKCSYWLNI